MTESEAKGFIQGKLDCMKKCGIFNKEDKISDNDCDNCEYCYSQGNWHEQKEAFQIAINALEKCKEQDNSSETVEINKKFAELEAKVYAYEKIIANSNFAPIMRKNSEEK